MNRSLIWKIVRRILIGFILLFFLALLGLETYLIVPFQIVFGWISFLREVVPNIRVDRWGLATALVSVAILAVGGHFFAAWLYRARSSSGVGSPRWRKRWTAGIGVMVVILFVSGIAAIGIIHQITWLVTSPDRLITVTMFRGDYRERALAQDLIATGEAPDVLRRRILAEPRLDLEQFQMIVVEGPPGTVGAIIIGPRLDSDRPKREFSAVTKDMVLHFPRQELPEIMAWIAEGQLGPDPTARE
jgi:hypothetical protein